MYQGGRLVHFFHQVIDEDVKEDRREHAALLQSYSYLERIRDVSIGPHHTVYPAVESPEHPYHLAPASHLPELPP
ncbi:MAG: hypothetical protein DDT36_01677 [Firmicutes bacterium]|nr:hypothetical protein [Bacillota bacterium]